MKTPPANLRAFSSRWIGRIGAVWLLASAIQLGWDHLKPRTHWTDCTVTDHTASQDANWTLTQEGTCKEGTVTLELNPKKQMERTPW